MIYSNSKVEGTAWQTVHFILCYCSMKMILWFDFNFLWIRYFKKFLKFNTISMNLIKSQSKNYKQISAQSQYPTSRFVDCFFWAGDRLVHTVVCVFEIISHSWNTSLSQYGWENGLVPFLPCNPSLSSHSFHTRLSVCVCVCVTD